VQNFCRYFKKHFSLTGWVYSLSPQTRDNVGQLMQKIVLGLLGDGYLNRELELGNQFSQV